MGRAMERRRPVSPAGAPAPRQARPHTLARDAPTARAGLGGALRAPGADVAVDGSGGQRPNLWGCAHTARWETPGVPPVARRMVIVGAPEGHLRRDACFGTDRPATPGPSRKWVIRRWAVAVTVEEARAQLGVATPRPWADQAIARTTPVR